MPQQIGGAQINKKSLNRHTSATRSEEGKHLQQKGAKIKIFIEDKTLKYVSLAPKKEIDDDVIA